MDKKRVVEFVTRWGGQGYEKGDTQKFWLELLAAIGYPHAKDVKFEHHLPNGGFIDVWLRDAGVLIEQKSLHIDLDKPEPRQGQLKTPLAQALDYVEDLPRPEQPRHVITCNFSTFRVYDRDVHSKTDLPAHAFEFTLDELASHPEYLGFIVDPANSRLEKEKEVSIQAGSLVGKLYDQMRGGYLDPDSPESMHALNVLCVRIVFCLYCEDSDLFPKDAFYRYLSATQSSGTRAHLKRLFTALNTPIDERDPYDTDLAPFPYVNGGLFKDEIEIPNFTPDMHSFLLEEVSGPVDWSRISPTIFGGIFESTLNPETRRSGGMHYTSPENIHKVIDPLFLDELRAEFDTIRNTPGQTPRAQKAALSRFHRKLCSLTFFDPACGSGNFLTETYLCLRSLEDDVLGILNAGQGAFALDAEDSGSRVSLNQFYGIEINDFAVTVAETALWISRLKANGDSTMLYDIASKDFPLIERPNILHANALRVDWNDVLPAEKCSYVMGNPPFVGQYLKSATQTEDVKLVWGKDYDGYLDYVTCWFKKSADYFQNVPGGRFAFVSTNSIAQGQPVPALFRPLFDAGWRVRFAHQTFPWTTEATGGAAVHCVITGFDKNEATVAQLFTYPRFGGEPVPIPAKNINGYLLDAPSVFAEKRSKLLSKEMTPVVYGSKPADGGFLIVEAEDYPNVSADPIAAKYLRRFVGAKELIHATARWCLWMPDDTLDAQDLEKSTILEERTTRVHEMRAASRKAATQALADTPHLFAECRPQTSGYVCIPAHFSENRAYATVLHLEQDVISGNANFCAADPDGFLFGIISSSMFITWQRAVGGRIKSDLRFSNTLVWNNLPLPPVAPELRQQIIEAGQAVLAARALEPEKSLAQHYTPGKLSAELQAAHDALDVLVDQAFGATQPCASNEERLAVLFARYAELTEAERAASRKGKN